MSQQLQITGGAKVRDLNDVIIGTSGVLSSLAFNVANGVPKLDSNGKILVSQLPNSVMEYLGTWDASTNTPTLVNGVGNQGDVYLCNVAGTVNFGAGPITFAVGDSAIYSGTIWQKAGGATGTVTSVGLTSTGNDAITITGSPITTSGNINLGFAGTNLQYINGAGDLTTFPTLISSIGLTMPSAFSVANSPLTSNGTIAVTGAGFPSQYIRGDGTLADFPTSGGGGSSVSYYLNGGTSQGTIGGVTYYEMSKTADTGTMADFSLTGNGFIVAFLTDAGDPAQLNIPAGNWNYEIYASMSANGGTPEMYAELYKYDGTTFTLIATSPHEILYDGTALNLYTFAMTVPSTTLAITDRLAVKLYATNSGGKTTTVHTQDSHLCQIITTFSTGITALNGLTAQVQYFATGTSGTDFNISSATATHTFNLPVASASNTGKLSSSDWSTFNGKVPYTGAIANVDLGAFSLTASTVGAAGFFGLGSGTVSGYIALKQGTTFLGNVTGYNSINAISTKYLLISDIGSTNYKSASFELGSLTNNTNRTYTLPDASGTLALLESSQTFTGINTFSSDITVNGVRVGKGASSVAGNTVVGQDALISNTGAGTGNTAIGYASLNANTSGGANTGIGNQALVRVTTGSNNIGIGFFAGENITTGNHNTIIGNYAGTAGMVNNIVLADGLGNIRYQWDGTSNNFDGILKSSGALWVNTSAGSPNSMIILAQVAGTQPPTLGNSSIGVNTTDFRFTATTTSTNFKSFSFSTSSLTNNSVRTYSMPDADGTLALTSSLAGYLPLTGGTLTGQLYINPTNTATVGLDVASNTTRFRSDNLEGFKRQLEITMGSGTLVQMVAKGFGANYGTDLAFYTATTSGVNGTPAIYITSSNNVGIGNGTPNIQGYVGKVLTIGSSTTAENVLEIYGGVTGADDAVGQIDFINSYATGGGKRIAIIKSQRSGSNNSGDLNFFTLNAGSLASRMYISPAGNVGIGTSSPTAISGFTSVCVNNATTGGFFEAQQGGTVLSRYGAQNDISFIDTVANIPFIIKTNSTERMRITSGGNVLVGTSTDVTTNVAGVMFAKVGTQGRMTIGSTSTGAQDIAYFFNPNGIVGYIQTNASLTIYSTNGSDIALKKNIESWDEKVLDNFNLIDAKLFNYKVEEDGTAKTKGYIANDAVNYFPEAYPKNESGMYSFNPSGMVVYLMKAIQEQNERIQNLQEQINILAK